MNGYGQCEQSEVKEFAHDNLPRVYSRKMLPQMKAQPQYLPQLPQAVLPVRHRPVTI